MSSPSSAPLDASLTERCILHARLAGPDTLKNFQTANVIRNNPDELPIFKSTIPYEVKKISASSNGIDYVVHLPAGGREEFEASVCARDDLKSWGFNFSVQYIDQPGTAAKRQKISQDAVPPQRKTIPDISNELQRASSTVDMKQQNPDKVSKSHALEDENAEPKEKLQMAEKRITLLCETVEKVKESEALWADRAAVLEGKVIELRAEQEEMFRKWATADNTVTEFEWQIEDLKSQADEYRVQAQTWATQVVELTNHVTAGIREAARLNDKYTKSAATQRKTLYPREPTRNLCSINNGLVEELVVLRQAAKDGAKERLELCFGKAEAVKKWKAGCCELEELRKQGRIFSGQGGEHKRKRGENFVAEEEVVGTGLSKVIQEVQKEVDSGESKKRRSRWVPDVVATYNLRPKKTRVRTEKYIAAIR
ncbi:hypothetical protein HDU98_000785 [Podochytrium sp. JEL0797]|nr:hypothetical protein HDU98_000785 [Podochytrium sp. JEL0797]